MNPPSDDRPRQDPPDRELPRQEPPVEELPPRPPVPVEQAHEADPAGAIESAEPATPEEPAVPAGAPFTRISAAWLGVWAGVVVVILLIVFIGQNTAPVRIEFLWMHGLIPTALALLMAGVGGAIIAMAVSAARILQLRRLVRRRR